MTQPAESVEWINAMKPKLRIEVHVDVAKVITALSVLIFTVASSSHYL